MQLRAAIGESRDRPVGQAEDAEFLRGGWIDRQTERIVSVALRTTDLFGVAITPHPAFAQQPVRRQPPAREDDRRPPAEPEQDERARDPADHRDQPAGDEVDRDAQRRAGHPAIELARDDEVRGERGILEVSNAWRLDAGVHELVVQPGRRAVAKVRADRLMQWRQDLQQHEHHAGPRQRHRQAAALLHRGDQ